MASSFDAGREYAYQNPTVEPAEEAWMFQSGMDPVSFVEGMYAYHDGLRGVEDEIKGASPGATALYDAIVVWADHQSSAYPEPFAFSPRVIFSILRAQARSHDGAYARLAKDAMRLAFHSRDEWRSPTEARRVRDILAAGGVIYPHTRNKAGSITAWAASGTD